MTTPPAARMSRLGWIGTGVMGRSMCGHLLAAGFAVSVHSRTRAKADPLVEQGAVWCDSPREVAEVSDVVFTMVGFPDDVRQVILCEEGVLAGSRPGMIIVDFTTSRPSLAQEIAAAAAQRSVTSLDAPVSGGDIGAREARLSIMVGGDRAAFDALMPCWQRLGKTIVHHGPPGAGQHAKMVNQILIASNMVGLCEALLYAYRAGLDPEKVLASVGAGAAGSWSLSNLGPRILAGDFAPGFYIEHFLKDLAIALEESRRMQLALPGLALAEQLYRAAAAQGYARNGTQALQLALAQLSNIDWKHR